jgi:hypothetical protein
MTQAFEIHGSSSVSTTTAIEFILDETGSMMSVWDQTIGGFNEYVNSQRAQPGTCLLSLTKFDTSGVRNAYNDVNIQEVPYLNRDTYRPNQSTNLYDAIGQRIKALEARVAAGTYPAETSFLVVIMTDGHDNASREFNAEGVKVLIKDKEAAGWTFVFLGANQDAWAVGQTFGMAKGNTMTYAAGNVAGAMETLSGATTAYRSLRAKGMVASASASNDFFSSVGATDAAPEVQADINTPSFTSRMFAAVMPSTGKKGN